MLKQYNGFSSFNLLLTYKSEKRRHGMPLTTDDVDETWIIWRFYYYCYCTTRIAGYRSIGKQQKLWDLQITHENFDGYILLSLFRWYLFTDLEYMTNGWMVFFSTCIPLQILKWNHLPFFLYIICKYKSLQKSKHKLTQI